MLRSPAEYLAYVLVVYIPHHLVLLYALHNLPPRQGGHMLQVHKAVLFACNLGLVMLKLDLRKRAKGPIPSIGT